MESTFTVVYMSTSKCTYAGEKYLLKSFSGWGTERNIIKISYHSKLLFVLHLLVNSVIIITIARRMCFHCTVSLTWKNKGDCSPFKCKSAFTHGFVWMVCLTSVLSGIYDFLMVLGEGWSLTGLLELVWN